MGFNDLTGEKGKNKASQLQSFQHVHTGGVPSGLFHADGARYTVVYMCTLFRVKLTLLILLCSNHGSGNNTEAHNR